MNDKKCEKCDRKDCPALSIPNPNIDISDESGDLLIMGFSEVFSRLKDCANFAVDWRAEALLKRELLESMATKIENLEGEINLWKEATNCKIPNGFGG